MTAQHEESAEAARGRSAVGRGGARPMSSSDSGTLGVGRRSWQRVQASLPLRFAAVGVLNTGFSYAIYATGLYAGLDFKTANLVALVVGIVFSFCTQSRFVFRDTTWRSFARYVVAWSAIYLLSIAAIAGFVSLGANAYLAGLMALPVSVASSYLLQRHLVFRPRS